MQPRADRAHRDLTSISIDESTGVILAGIKSFFLSSSFQVKFSPTLTPSWSLPHTTLPTPTCLDQRAASFSPTQAVSVCPLHPPQALRNAHALCRYLLHPRMAHRARIRGLRVHGRRWTGGGNVLPFKTVYTMFTTDNARTSRLLA